VFPVRCGPQASFELVRSTATDVPRPDAFSISTTRKALEPRRGRNEVEQGDSPFGPEHGATLFRRDLNFSALLFPLPHDEPAENHRKSCRL
jgi:hypothetical protein